MDRRNRGGGRTGSPYGICEAPPENTVPPAPRPRPASVWRELWSLALRVAAIAGSALLLFTFVYGLHYNIGPNMNPMVQDGDLIVYYRLNKAYKAGDLLLLRFQNQIQVRRVIAAAGDTVDITENGLWINGALQQERNIHRQTQRYTEGIDFPVTLREGEVFVLGDAREDVTDSRIYGPVRVQDTLGKAITILRRRNL